MNKFIHFILNKLEKKVFAMNSRLLPHNTLHEDPINFSKYDPYLKLPAKQSWYIISIDWPDPY